MFRHTLTLALPVAGYLLSACSLQAEVTGTYIEARTCQVYTGPCFANGETGLAGKEAVMAWNVEKGILQGADISGLNVVMVVKADKTLGFQGFESAKDVKASVMVDERASTQQREALVAMARQHAGLSESALVRVEATPVRVSLDTLELNGSVQAGKSVKLTTRKARKSDCICSNESAYYPPLVSLKNFVPGVTIDGTVRAKGLGSRWEVPGDRNVYMATFAR